MYRKATNPKAIYCQNQIKDAMLKFLEQQCYAALSISTLCNEARIGRRTFYNHFEIKDDVIDYILDDYFDLFLNEYGIDTLFGNKEKCPNAYFDFWNKHRDFITKIYMNQLIGVFENNLMRGFHKAIHQSMHNEYDYYINITCKSLCTILFTWAEHGFKESLEDIKLIGQKYINQP